MKRFITFLYLCCTVAVLSGCLASVPLDVSVNLTHNNQNITIQQGQELIVNLTRQSSAYVWEPVSSTSGILSPLKRKALTDQASIIDQYHFTALSIGQEQLVFEERPQNKDMSASTRTFSLNVQVIK